MSNESTKNRFACTILLGYAGRDDHDVMIRVLYGCIKKQTRTIHGSAYDQLPVNIIPEDGWYPPASSRGSQQVHQWAEALSPARAPFS